jgi:pimeloyl-ACP methyl ester carboxylesterase
MKMQSEATGQGTPLVLVPGGLTGWVSWIPFAERLSANRKVIRVQLISVQLGLEGRPLPDGYSPATEKLALAETLEGMGLTKPVDLAAWSYGAEVTLDFAADHPEWVRTLTLIEPAAFWTMPSLDEDTKRRIENDRQLSRDDITEDALVDFLVGTALLPPDQDARALPQWPTWSRHRQSLRAVASIAEYQADRSRLAKVTAPTLLVKGSDSVDFHRQIVDDLAAQLPNARLREWPGGHAPHIVSMEPFLQAMAQLHNEASVPS